MPIPRRTASHPSFAQMAAISLLTLMAAFQHAYADQACASCHQNVDAGTHAKLPCSSCHGDATAHLRNPTAAPPRHTFKDEVKRQKDVGQCRNCHTTADHPVDVTASGMDCIGCHRNHPKRKSK